MTNEGASFAKCRTVPYLGINRSSEAKTMTDGGNIWFLAVAISWVAVLSVEITKQFDMCDSRRISGLDECLTNHSQELVPTDHNTNQEDDFHDRALSQRHVGLRAEGALHWLRKSSNGRAIT
jgi:hypothetical protein